MPKVKFNRVMVHYVWFTQWTKDKLKTGKMFSVHPKFWCMNAGKTLDCRHTLVRILILIMSWLVGGLDIKVTLHLLHRSHCAPSLDRCCSQRGPQHLERAVTDVLHGFISAEVDVREQDLLVIPSEVTQPLFFCCSCYSGSCDVTNNPQ